MKNLLSVGIVPLLVCSIVYLTIRLKAVNLKNIGLANSLVLGNKTKRGSLSTFGAFATVIGGNLGAGNIAGIAVALQCGGPGTLFWLFLMCLFSGIIKFTGTYLGVCLRKRGYSESGEHVGGPMIYLGMLLKHRILAIIYVTLLVFGALTTGNLVQVNTVAKTASTLSINPFIISVVMMLCVGYTILGKTKRFANVVTSVVPVMAITYIIISIVLMCHFHDKVLPAFSLILHSAISSKSFCGGIFSFSVWQTIRYGIDRGLMATDAGLGLESIVHSSAESDNSIYSNAFVQGLISSISPIIVALACITTGMILIITDVWTLPNINPMEMCIFAFEKIMPIRIAAAFVLILLYVFAFTTVLTWSFCSTKGIEAIVKRNVTFVKIWKYIFILTIPLGTVCNTAALWKFADIGTNLMLLINLSGILILLPFVLKHLAQEHRKK